MNNPAATAEGPTFFVTPGYGERVHRDFYYSQAVRIGDRVEIAGQGGWDDDWNFPEDLEHEIIQAFDNVERVITAAGASWGGVYYVTSYHVPMNDEALSVMVAQMRQRMPDQAPLWTCVGVPKLGDPQMRVEIVVNALANV